MGKSKVLVVGGTGHIGSKIVRESLAQGHTTCVLQRLDMGMDVNKLQMMFSFKASGAQLVEGLFLIIRADHQSLVNALKQVDVFTVHQVVLVVQIAVRGLGKKSCKMKESSVSLTLGNPSGSGYLEPKKLFLIKNFIILIYQYFEMLGKVW
ncbi:hypothetical protein HYC85_023015 [Camellia sinensis]|uniref:NmrA-like domain-containing protein n=1 Tax=Camellia sinensis TaxID=4442 RepID=A0A7J7GH98_CAMSI|nr:hypothetical protein HYC85_023015 [Camellia sinensis]